MPSHQKRRGRRLDADALVALTDEWPAGWAGLEEDVAPGRRLVTELRPFVMHLLEERLSPRTVRRHLDNLWVIGGEIIREFNYDPLLRRCPARQLLLDAIVGGEALLARHATEQEQRSLDTTARKLFKFLTSQEEDPQPQA